MLKPLDYKWVCKNCGKEVFAYQGEELFQGSVKCPDCGSEMVGRPIVHRGPRPRNPFKKY